MKKFIYGWADFVTSEDVGERVFSIFITLLILFLLVIFVVDSKGAVIPFLICVLLGIWVSIKVFTLLAKFILWIKELENGTD